MSSSRLIAPFAEQICIVHLDHSAYIPLIVVIGTADVDWVGSIRQRFKDVLINIKGNLLRWHVNLEFKLQVEPIVDVFDAILIFYFAEQKKYHK